MLRDTRPWVGVDAGIDVHCADRVCVGCCAHVCSSLAVSRAICSLLWRSWEQRTLRLLLFKARLTRQAWRPSCWFREQETECREISEDSNLVASPFVPGPAAMPPSAGPVQQPPAREGIHHVK